MTEGELYSDGEGVFFDDDIEQQVRRIVTTARQNITFVTPYIELWVHLKDAIHDAIERKVDITFFIREGETPRKPEDLKWLHANNVTVRTVPSLHAKIYLNETTVLISSMNITRSSTLDSKDFAMIVKREEGAKMFREYVSHLAGKASMTQSSRSIGGYVSSVIARANITQPSNSIEHQTSKDGNCIRCGDNIRFNTKKPLCADCYPKWAKYANEDYTEKYCHSCGKSAETTFKHPLCLACFQSN